MQAERPSYFKGVIDKLHTLSSDQQPLWGSMTPQHMVEHIVGSWRISNGRAKAPIVLDESEVQRRREFLFSDSPYERNIQNPVFGDGLPPLRKKSLGDAIEQLEDEMNAFFEYHQSNPSAIETHPVFGDLDYNGWIVFQTKHMQHHLAQFGLN